MIDIANRYIVNEGYRLTDIEMNGHNMTVTLYKNSE
jgi:hypothetical protein